MKGIGCISNSLTDGDTVAKGSGNVFADFLPVSVDTDPTTVHGCFPPTVMIATTGTVFVNNKPVLRHGDSNQPHTCVSPPNLTDSGTLISTSNVTVGD